MLKKIILIRHGQTPWNAKKRYMGSSDIGLSRIGKAQAGKVKKAVKCFDVDCVYASDRVRAMDFASIAFPGMKIKKTKGLREIDLGALEGLTYRVISKKYPGLYDNWTNNKDAIKIPGGESLKIFRRRVMRAFMNIIRKNDFKTAAVVSHAGPISVFIDHVKKTNNFWANKIDLASISVVEVSGIKMRLSVSNRTEYLKNG